MTKVGLARISPVPHPSMAEREEQPEACLYRTLVKLPSKDVPVWINHDESRVIGRVRELTRGEEPGLGMWHLALIELHDPPEWANATTPVSLSTKPLSMSTCTMFGRELADEALVVEISLLSPSKEPAEPLARMLTLHDAGTPRLAHSNPVGMAVPTAAIRSAAPTRGGQVDELAWVDALVDEGWSFEDAFDHVARECGYDARYLSNRRGRLAA